MKIKLITLLMYLMVSMLMFETTGCSVHSAMNQPDKKDINVLKRGTPRFEVIGELGEPVYTEKTQAGRIVDTFSFIQGYSKGVKATRALGHGLLDIATLGIWEIIGSPTEAIASGDKVTVRVTYDKSNLVDKVIVLKGKDEVNSIL